MSEHMFELIKLKVTTTVKNLPVKSYFDTFQSSQDHKTMASDDHSDTEKIKREEL